MATNNVLKFKPRPKKPAPTGQPSPVVLGIVAIVTVALVAAIWWYFNH